MRSQSHCRTGGGHHGRPSSTSAAAPRVGLDRGRGARAAHAGVGRPATAKALCRALRPAGESRGDLVRVVGEGPFTPLRQVRDGAASCPRRGGGAAG